jgi:hypothetical protein
MDKAAKADASLHNCMNTGPIIDEKHVSRKEAFTGTELSINYIYV